MTEQDPSTQSRPRTDDDPGLPFPTVREVSLAAGETIRWDGR